MRAFSILAITATTACALALQVGCRQSETGSERSQTEISSRTPDADASEGRPDAASESFALLEIGQIVPSYDVRTLTGAVERLGPTQPVTLLNLWATWCAPCRAEFPDLEALHQRLKGDGLRLLAVDIDAESPAILEAFAADLNLTMTIARDTAGEIQQRYPSIGVPASFLLSESGELVRSWTGIIPVEDYQFIEQYVAAESPN